MKHILCHRIERLFICLVLCLGMLPVTALAANTVVIKKVVYTNGNDGTASAAITFTYTGDKITWIDPMIGKSEGSTAASLKYSSKL